jgi:hypothetical protein
MKLNNFEKCICVLLCIICGVAVLFFAPELYKLSHLNIGPSLAMGFAVGGALIWDSVSDKRAE